MTETNIGRVDYQVRVEAFDQSHQFILKCETAGKAIIRIDGLSRGGAVGVWIDGAEPDVCELFAAGGLDQGYADAALVTTYLEMGEHNITVSEQPGMQVVRAADSRLWFATTSEDIGHALFSLDFDQLEQLKEQYPITVRFGPKYEPFYWISGKLDEYATENYAQSVRDTHGSSGTDEATLSYVAEHPERNLVMPHRLTLHRVPGGGFAIRFYQGMQATGEPSFGENLEFLHLVINEQYGRDWEDGVPDFGWYRTQRQDAPDTLPGSHTTLARMDDDTMRQFPFPNRTDEHAEMVLSNPHHTGAAIPMEARNTIGGWFTKTGVGSIGLTFHRYEANFRDDLTPLHSHCGDGADTHIFLFWGNEEKRYDHYRPLGMQAGDRVDIEYSMTCLPSEPLHTDIEDINEADLFFFGKEAEQQSQIVGWIGTREALGLQRSDGSVILLGIGVQPGRAPLPAQTVQQARKVYRVFDIGRKRRTERLDIVDGTVEVVPRRITVIDCGSARKLLN